MSLQHTSESVDARMVPPRANGLAQEKLTAAVVPSDGTERAVFCIPAAEYAAARDNALLEGAYVIFERFVAAIALIVAFPFMVLEGILIWIDSGSPVLFRQPRTSCSERKKGAELIGRKDLKSPTGSFAPDVEYLVPKLFPFVKFRTMYADARQRFPHLYAYKFAPGEFHTRHFKDDGDPRVTRLGKYLRRLTFDEFPNFWCVLTGDMRLVGPRPEIPEILSYYSAEEMQKFSVKPGITGLAQINGRGLLSWGETLKWDLEYVRTRSVLLDLKILFLTFWYVAIRRGAL
jgi:lipopolysaccharide/colanic/teichoic acid biosynthesis glycosyltransferase